MSRIDELEITPVSIRGHRLEVATCTHKELQGTVDSMAEEWVSSIHPRRITFPKR